jgi:hypothetical protein
MGVNEAVAAVNFATGEYVFVWHEAMTTRPPSHQDFRPRLGMLDQYQRCRILRARCSRWGVWAASLIGHVAFCGRIKGKKIISVSHGNGLG